MPHPVSRRPCSGLPFAPQAIEVPKRRGLDRYIKKKGKAPLETYVPAVLQARGQMLKAGDVMGACCWPHQPNANTAQIFWGLFFYAAVHGSDQAVSTLQNTACVCSLHDTF